jgi:hypothetical protein
MKTYPNIAAAAADPTSSFARFRAEARARMEENAKAIDTLMAQGATREQAWARLLAEGRA